MQLIVLTPECPRDDESELITRMLAMGVHRIHLRHPACAHERLRNIIEAVPLELRGRLTIHDSFDLVRDFPQLGVNLNARNPSAPDERHGLISRSCHSVDETRLSADYTLFSPIFPSISKPGYSRQFTDEELLGLPQNKVFALGGVSAERIRDLKRYPFAGAAALGSVWTENTNRATVLANVASLLEQLK